MDILHLQNRQVTLNPAAPEAGGFLWLDATHEEVAADPEGWRNRVAELCLIQLYDLHLADIQNLTHPSHFDSTEDYALLVFRKLALQVNGIDATESGKPDHRSDAADPRKPRMPAALQKLNTAPVSFVLGNHCLLTIRPQHSKTIEQMRQRLLAYQPKEAPGNHNSRLPNCPEELMLRMLNSMVDQYLELRQPLSSQLDRWQHALLDPRRPFKNWLALLHSRMELRKLDYLCEEQHDAMQELRDHLIDTADPQQDRHQHDLLLVRIHDVMEHIQRVLQHARRLEATLESAVQIHFSAMAHRTSEIMRTLTVITALFMPLTLITGIFGMNFESMPLLKHQAGFWIIMLAMLLIVVILLLYFRHQRYLDDQRQHEQQRRHD